MHLSWLDKASVRDGHGVQRLSPVKCDAYKVHALVFPRTGKRPHSRGLGRPAPVSGRQLLAILSYGHGFRAPVSARFIPISVSGEGRLVRRLPESGSRNARWVIRRDADVGSTASVGSLAKSYFDCPDADRVKPLAGSHQAIASCESRHRN
jgi:hypothetical protein